MLDSSIIDHLLKEPPENLAKKVAITVGRGSGKIPTAVVAQACGVSVTAVNNWKDNGRVAKRHIKTLVMLTGLPPAWWLPGFDGLESGPFALWPFEKWIPYTRIQTLNNDDLGYIAGRLEDALKTLENRPRKSNAA